MVYFIWKAKAGKNVAVLTNLKNTEDVIDIKRGRKLKQNMEREAFFEMNSKYPKDTLLEDQMSNMDYMVVLSPKFAGYINDFKLDGINLLPVSIKNHNGTIHPDEYSIVHATKIIDCIDKENSDLLWNKIDTDMISGCYELVLNTTKILANDQIFRLKHMETFIVVREDLVDKINAMGFSGVNFKEVDEFEV